MEVDGGILELVMDDQGPASIIMRDTEPQEALDAALATFPNQEIRKVTTQFGSEHEERQQPNSENYVLMDEELMKHALSSHDENDSGGQDPLEVETEEMVHIVCRWMNPQQCDKEPYLYDAR